MSVNNRIIIIDDDQEIWRAYQNVLAPGEPEGYFESTQQIVDLLKSDDNSLTVTEQVEFQLQFASQGQDGYRMVEESLASQNPYAVAFIDVRMPPGWDGMITAAKIRRIDPMIEIVIVTAYSDRSREEIVREVGTPDKLLFLRKPFDSEELTQLAISLSSKWNLARLEEEANANLKQSQERLRDLIETTTDWVWEMDAQGRLTYCSPICEDIYGYRPEELKGRLFYDVFLPPDEIVAAKALLEHCVSDITGYQGVERQCRKKDGESIYIESNCAPVIDDHGKIIGFRGVDRDISERHKRETERQILEEQFRQSQKMEALGVLAGGIAHDLNNVLTPIMGNTQLAILRLGKDHPVCANLLEVQKGAEKAANLIRQILTFSRKQVLEFKLFNLNETIEEFSKMLRRLIRSDIEFKLDLNNDLWTIGGDISQVEQVLINLVVNAQDAVQKLGKITIRTRNIKIPDGLLFDVDKKPIAGEFVELAVTDNGVGIDRATQARIFDPFFTTKEMGKGTGLGLSTVYGVVKQQNGFIRLESTPGDGTSFYIYFKKTDKKVDEDVADEKELVRGGSETILLAEDNADVRMVTTVILESYGYQVLEAASGNEAVRIFSENSEEIDMLLTDVVMPGMGGRAVIETIRAKHPHLPVILMSAYQYDVVTQESTGLKGVTFVQKPFTPQGLGKTIREVLDAKERN